LQGQAEEGIAESFGCGGEHVLLCGSCSHLGPLLLGMPARLSLPAGTLSMCPCCALVGKVVVSQFSRRGNVRYRGA
jgi:hypothetical protein